MWEKVVKKLKSLSCLEQAVSIYTDGWVAISLDLYDIMGKPDSIEVFIDKHQHAMGLKPSSLEDSDSYYVQHRKNNKETPFIQLKRIFYIMGYTIIPNGRKKAEWDEKEGMVIVKLADEV